MIVDFVAAEARYQQHRRVVFSSGKHLKSSSKTVGLPVNTIIKNAFEEACEWLEKEPELHSISQFAEKVIEFP